MAKSLPSLSSACMLSSSRSRAYRDVRRLIDPPGCQEKPELDKSWSEKTLRQLVRAASAG